MKTLKAFNGLIITKNSDVNINQRKYRVRNLKDNKFVTCRIGKPFPVIGSEFGARKFNFFKSEVGKLPYI